MDGWGGMDEWREVGMVGWREGWIWMGGGRDGYGWMEGWMCEGMDG